MGYTIENMNALARWMEDRGWDDVRLAAAVDLDRSQISRLRRGKSAASHETARRLQKITGVAWHAFLDLAEPHALAPKRKRAA